MITAIQYIRSLINKNLIWVNISFLRHQAFTQTNVD